MGFSGQRYWSGLPFRPPRDLPDPGIEPMSLMSPVLAGQFFVPVGPPQKNAVSLADAGLRCILMLAATPNEHASKRSSPERRPLSTADPKFIFLCAPGASSTEKSKAAGSLMVLFSPFPMKTELLKLGTIFGGRGGVAVRPLSRV